MEHLWKELDITFTLFEGKMELSVTMTERLNINKIDKSTEEWTCKFQVVYKGHPRTNREGNKKYQLMILKDEKNLFAIWLTTLLSTQLLQLLMACTFAADSVDFVAYF
ncbi:hypothetical protein H5410_035575 [Solanum commersonii]|uniref:Uncharacterized protein n=1 Tax=Solanum commersonii TaxID=4109 RepID=A0A9J5Y393_SOLCO|nr:hypothetical protein H5410_035575 [Solanum commersonii]